MIQVFSQIDQSLIRNYRIGLVYLYHVLHLLKRPNSLPWPPKAEQIYGEVVLGHMQVNYSSTYFQSAMDVFERTPASLL